MVGRNRDPEGLRSSVSQHDLRAARRRSEFVQHRVSPLIPRGHEAPLYIALEGTKRLVEVYSPSTAYKRLSEPCAGFYLANRSLVACRADVRINLATKLNAKQNVALVNFMRHKLSDHIFAVDVPRRQQMKTFAHNEAWRELHLGDATKRRTGF